MKIQVVLLLGGIVAACTPTEPAVEQPTSILVVNHEGQPLSGVRITPLHRDPVDGLSNAVATDESGFASVLPVFQQRGGVRVAMIGYGLRLIDFDSRSTIVRDGVAYVAMSPARIFVSSCTFGTE